MHCDAGKLPAPAEDSIARFFANLGPKGIVQAGPSAQAASPARPPQVSPPAPMTNGKPETNLSPKAPSVGSLPMPSGSRATGPGSEREDSQGAEQDSAPTSVLFTQRNQTPLRTPRLAPDPKVVRPSDFLALPLLPTSRSSVRGDAEVCLQSLVAWQYCCSVVLCISRTLSSCLPYEDYWLRRLCSKVLTPIA